MLTMDTEVDHPNELVCYVKRLIYHFCKIEKLSSANLLNELLLQATDSTFYNVSFSSNTNTMTARLPDPKCKPVSRPFPNN
jgi:hypothetical protein